MSDTSFRDSESQLVTIYSIGHSNQPLEAFLELLRKHNVQTLIDIRSHPYSRYVPHFNSPELGNAVRHSNIQYLFMGKELGGRPDGEEFYDADNHVMYSRVAESPLFLKGIRRLEEEGRASRAVIMCSEEDPTSCHRHLLIGRVLAEQGISLLHILGDGHIQTEEELASHEGHLYLSRTRSGMSKYQTEMIGKPENGDLYDRFHKEDSSRILRNIKTGWN